MSQRSMQRNKKARCRTPVVWRRYDAGTTRKNEGSQVSSDHNVISWGRASGKRTRSSSYNGWSSGGWCWKKCVIDQYDRNDDASTVRPHLWWWPSVSRGWNTRRTNSEVILRSSMMPCKEWRQVCFWVALQATLVSTRLVSHDTQVPIQQHEGVIMRRSNGMWSHLCVDKTWSTWQSDTDGSILQYGDPMVKCIHYEMWSSRHASPMKNRHKNASNNSTTADTLSAISQGISFAHQKLTDVERKIL